MSADTDMMLKSDMRSGFGVAWGKLARGFGALAVLCLLAGCAGGQKTADPGVNDPYEGFNRKVFNFNLKLDKHVLQPIARGYRDTLPDWTRSAIRSGIDNLNTPIVLANDLLQGDFKRAGDTVARFTMNTLYGPLGLRDVAAENGVKPHGEDFGQTLAVWGVDSGPYLVVPFLGPSNPRDLGGKAVDIAFNPLTYVDLNSYIWIPIGVAAVDVVDERSRTLDAMAELQKTSIDFYASVRSLYSQARENAIHNGQMDDTQLPDL